MSFVNRGKTLASSLILALLATSTLAADAPKAAAAGPLQKVAVLDMAAALFNSDRAKAIDQEIQKQTADDQGKLKALADEGKKLQEKRKKDDATMSADEKRKSDDRLQEISVQYQYLGEKLQKLMEERRTQFQQTNQEPLIKAITEVVKDGGYDMVFRSEAVLYFGNTGYDITSKVTEQLNKQK